MSKAIIPLPPSFNPEFDVSMSAIVPISAALKHLEIKFFQSCSQTCTKIEIAVVDMLWDFGKMDLDFHLLWALIEERRVYYGSTSTFAKLKSLINTWVGPHKNLLVRLLYAKVAIQRNCLSAPPESRFQDATQHKSSQQTSVSVPSCQVVLSGIVRRVGDTVILVQGVSYIPGQTSKWQSTMGHIPKVPSWTLDRWRFHAKLSAQKIRFSLLLKTRLIRHIKFTYLLPYWSARA